MLDKKYQPKPADPEAVAEAEELIRRDPPKIGLGPTEWKYVGLAVAAGVQIAQLYTMWRDLRNLRFLVRRAATAPAAVTRLTAKTLGRRRGRISPVAAATGAATVLRTTRLVLRKRAKQRAA